MKKKHSQQVKLSKNQTRKMTVLQNHVKYVAWFCEVMFNVKDTQRSAVRQAR
jgi:hypothetical protein